MAKIMDAPINTNDQSIGRVLAAGLPVALIFYSRSLEPALDQGLNRAARDAAGRALIARIETKDNPASVRRFQVSALPALVTWRDGKEVSRVERVGSTEFEQHLAHLLSRGPLPHPVSRPAPDGRPKVVTDASFEAEVLRSALPVLVDFWAPWCGPCRMTDPIVQKLAAELAGKLVVAKVNVDENPHLSGQLGVQSIPTMLVVKAGKVVDRWAGALPEQAVRSRIQRHLG